VLLDAFAIRLTEGYTAAAPTLARSLELLLAMDDSDDEVSRQLSVSTSRNGNIVALELWDDGALHRLAERQVQVARDAGALVHLQFALSFLARSHMLAGDLTAATLTIDESRSIAEATGNPALVNAPMILAAWRGREPEASELIEATSEEAAARRWTSHNYARSVLANGLGRHDAARDAAWEAFQPDPVGYSSLLVPELAEAASRTADGALLDLAADWLSERTGVLTSQWASGIEARVRALLSEDETAESLYRESIAHLAAPACGSSSHAPTCCSVSGCAANAAASTPVSICAPPSRCSATWAPRRSRAGPNVSCWPPASAPASEPSTPSTS